MLRLVLFDIDGTLIQTGGAGQQAFARVFATEFGISNGSERLRFAGRTDPSIVREFFALNRIEPSPENFTRFFDSYVFWLEQMLAQLPGCVLPGVGRFIERLNELEHPPLLGLLTGNIRLGAEIKLRHYNLWHCFQVGGFGDDHENRNRIAAVARDRGGHLLQRALPGSEVLVIGDTPLDIECAHAIGARVLAVATGNYTVDQLRDHMPHRVVESLESLPVEEHLNI